MRILVTRAEEQGRATAARLAALGHVAVVAPLTRIVLDGDGALPLDGVQALIVTSRNGVAALGLRNHPPILRALPVFAVGDRTARAARDLGFAEVASADGDRHDLADLVAERLDPAMGALLWVAGAERSGDLADDLEARGFTVRVAEVYRAEPAQALPEDVARDLDGGRIDAVAVYSPRSAEILLGALAAHGLTPVTSGLRIHAISEATAEPFRRAGHAVVVAEQPDEPGLLATFAPSDPGSRELGATEIRRSIMAAKSDADRATEAETLPTGAAAIEKSNPSSGDVLDGGAATLVSDDAAIEVEPVVADEEIAPASEPEVASSEATPPSEPAAPPPSEPAAAPPGGAPSTGTVSTPIAAVAAVVATLLGGAIGIAGSQMLAPKGADAALETRLAVLEAAAAKTPTSEAAASGQAPTALETRLAGLEKELAAFEAKPAADLAALDLRLAKVEAAPALTLPADLGDRLAGLEQGARERMEGAKTSLTEALAALPDDSAVRAAFADVAGRIDRALDAAREKASADAATLKAQVDRLQGEVETRMDGLSGSGQTLGARVDAATTALSKELEKRNEDIARVVDGIRARVGSIEGLRGDVDGLIGRLGSVEKGQLAAGATDGKVDAVESRLATVEAGADAARRAQAEAVVAVALADLRSVVDSGRPFKGELEVARRAAAGGNVDLGALDAFADKGVTTVTALREQLPQVARAMQEAEESRTAGDGVFARLFAHAVGAVRIRPAGETAGEDIGSRIAKVEARMKAGDLVGALAAWKALPEAARAVGAAWGGALEARVSIDAALTAQTAAVVSKLSQPAQ